MPSETQPQTAETLMSYEELGDILAAVGNHEAKAAVIMAMEPGALYTGTRLSSLIAHRQGKEFGAFPAHNVVAAYCSQTFEPIGLVARVVNISGKKEFGITPRGEKEGKAFAGHLMDLSLRHPETSLRRIFGMTHSRDKLTRPPILRYQILFDLLVSKDGVTQLEIAESTGLHEQEVRDHITEMEEDGIITSRLITRPSVYQPVANGEITGERSSGGRSRELTSQVNQAILEAAGSEDKRLTKSLLAQKLESDREADKIERSVNQRVKKLQALGVIKKETEQASERVVWLDPAQKELAYEVCDLMEKLRLRSTEFTDEGISKGYDLLYNPYKIKTLVEKSHNNSPQASAVPFEEKANRILEALRVLGPANANQISSAINDSGITPVSVNKALKRMREKGSVNITTPKQGRNPSLWGAVPRD